MALRDEVVQGVLSFRDIGVDGTVLPPSGMSGIAIKNGSFVKVNPDGSTANVSAGGVAWIAARESRAASLNGNVAFNSEIFNECTSINDFDQTNTAPAASTIATNLDGGVLLLTSGNGANAQSRVQFSGKGSFVSNATTKSLYCYWRVKFNGPSGANCMSIVGVGDSSLAHLAFFGIWGSSQANGSDSKFVVFQTTAGAAATGINIDVTNFHDLEFFSDGTTGKFFLDGVDSGVNVTMANLTAVGIAPFAQSNTGDSTVRVVSIDKIYAGFNGS